MTRQQDENEPRGARQRNIEGVRIDLPFASFRLGRGGWEWDVTQEDDAYARARKRVRARLGLYRHLATFAAVLFALIFIDLVTGGGVSALVLWIAGIWGSILVWQAFNVFVIPLIWSPETEERMIEEELRRQREP
jgi:hypothetical protein